MNLFLKNYIYKILYIIKSIGFLKSESFFVFFHDNFLVFFVFLPIGFVYV